ncbi:MAG: hypothetical protein ACXVCP_03750 [Bdellovibrio sp.]
MSQNSNKHKRFVMGVCLAFSQLFAFHVALANTPDELTFDNTTQTTTAVSISKKRPTYARPLLFSLPRGGEFIFSGGASYTNYSASYSATAGSYLQQKTDSSGMSSNLSTAYGFTENFYSRISVNYGNGKGSTTVTDSAKPYTPAESKSSYDGFSEPDLVVGAQIRLGSTQLFSEVSTDIPLGDQVLTQTSINEKSSNNLNGGMSYSPRIGITQDLGSVFLMGAASYTFWQERTSRQQNIGSTYTTKQNGGNSLNLLAAMEFKNLSRLGFMAAYSKSDSTENRTVETYQVTTSPGQEAVVASTYLGIKITGSLYLMPQVSYATVISNNQTSGIYKINTDRNDNWKAGVAARFYF